MKHRTLLSLSLLLILTQLVTSLTGNYLDEAWNYTTKEIISSISVGDVDGDGRVEAVVASSSEGMVRVLDGNGEIIWNYTIPTYIFTVVARDVDSDGKAEVVVGAGSHVYLLNETGELLWKYYVGNNNVRVLEPEGRSGFYVGVYSQDCVKNSVILLDANGDKKWSYEVGYRIPVALHAVDLDADSNDEVIVGFIERGVDTVKKSCIPAYNKPSSVLALDEFGKLLWEDDTAGGVVELTSGDVNSDNSTEILVGSHPDLILLRSNGTRLWNTSTVSMVDVIRIADLKSDGKKEILFGSDQVHMLDARGGSRWNAKTADRTYTLEVSDLNKDGSQEVVAGSDALYVFSDTGEQLYKSKQLVSVGDLGVGDFDGDGMDDIVAGAVRQVILFKTGFSAKKQRALTFETMAQDLLHKGDNKSAIEYAKKARTTYLDIGDLPATSRMLALIDMLEGKTPSNATTTSISTPTSSTPKPAETKDITASIKNLLYNLKPSLIKEFLSTNKKLTVYALVGAAILVFALCVIYVTSRVMEHTYQSIKTPKIDAAFKTVRKKELRRGLIKGVERRPGMKINGPRKS